MKKLLVLLMVLFVAALGFAGGKGEEGPAPEAAAPAAETAREEVVFTILNGSEPPTLDAALMEDTTSHRIYMALFEGLLINDPKTNDGIPAVAESWTISDDGLVYTFKLRKSTWSDGVPITAQTVVDSWLRELNPETGAPYAWMMTMVVKGAAEYNEGEAGPEAVQIRALDDYTFQMDLVGPAPYVIGMLPHQAFAIVPLHTIEKYGDQWTLPGNMVCNGPFLLEEWKPQEVLTVVKNDMYWDADAVKLDKIIFIPTDDYNTGLNMYLAGEADWNRGLIPTDQIDALKTRDDFQVSPQLATYFYEVNHGMKPLNDVRVRKALSMAIDRQTLVEKVSRGGQIPANVIVPEFPGYKPPKGNPYNVEMAKQLLADAGFPGGQGFPDLTILYNTSEGHKKIAEYVQQQWETNLGVVFKIENVEWKTLLARGKEQDFQVLRMGWVGDYQDPNTFLELFQTDGGMNYGKYSNPKFDELLQSAARMPAGQKRLDTLREAEEIFITQDQGILPIYHYTNLDLIDLDKWGGWYGSVQGIHPWKFIYLK
ncbi:MAG: peptide ABC transporter substrate-binding protein [Spirochaetales bacterium]|nr:peptide ABC transporter substrate-binding protein [Spirochaetales bacterium]